MSGSALLGQPPNNENDALIILGWWKLLYGANPPPPGYPSTIPAPVPPNAPHDSLQAYVIGTSALIIFLTTLITGTRLFLRLYRRELRWGADDWAILLGASGVVVFFGLTLAVGIHGGAGKHMYDTTYAEYAFLFMVRLGCQMSRTILPLTLIQYFNVSEIIYYCTLGVIKISICLFNRRLTGMTSRKWMIFHHIFLIVLVGYIIASLCVFIVPCRPPVPGARLAASGTLKHPPVCGPNKNNNAIVALSSIHSAMDFVLLAVPMTLLVQMKMELGKKIRLGLLFSIGTVSSVGSIMRQVYQKGSKEDLTYAFPLSLKWLIIDMFFAVTVASLPILNVLFFVPLFLRTRSKQSKDSPSPPGPTNQPHSWPKNERTPPQRADSADDDDLEGLHGTSASTSHTLNPDEEWGAGRKESQGMVHMRGAGPQPEWEQYHPQLKIT